jgi:hypothetical protein
MPPRYTVRAKVIDIRRDTPRPTDAVLVDTQVWYWKVYPSAVAVPGSATSVQSSSYADYHTDCLAAGAIV